MPMPVSIFIAGHCNDVKQLGADFFTQNKLICFRARIMRWVFWSIVFGVVGGALCEFSKNGGPIPINKNLWSVSYCLVTAGMAFFIQAVLYFLVDLKMKWGGRPLYYAG